MCKVLKASLCQKIFYLRLFYDATSFCQFLLQHFVQYSFYFSFHCNINFIFLLTTYSSHRNLSFNSQINVLLLNNYTSGLFNLICSSPYFTGWFFSNIKLVLFFPLLLCKLFYFCTLFFLSHFSPISLFFSASFARSYFPACACSSVLCFPLLNYSFFTHCSALHICICHRLWALFSIWIMYATVYCISINLSMRENSGIK